MVGMIVNKPIRVIRDKYVVKGSRKTKEFSNKPMEVKRCKGEVNEPKKLKE